MGQLSDSECVELLDKGEGGQGKVFKAFKRASDPTRLMRDLRSLIRQVQELTSGGEETDAAMKLVRLLRTEFERTPWRALKKLHDAADARDAKNADARMRDEINTPRTINHPALLKIVDWPEDDSSGEVLWYVSELHSGGTLEDKQPVYEGDLLAAIRAIRPVVHGVAHLHKNGLVHRDIKPF